ncbi:MAG: hypothetical protein Q7S89_01225 [bacterium]|nr:hypothetical protein [bacterium]
MQGLVQQIKGFTDIFQLGATGVSIEGKNPEAIVIPIINSLLGLSGIFFIVLMLWGGFTWMSSQGEEEKVEKAKKILVAATVGLVITLAAASIWAFISTKIIERLIPSS